MYTLKAIAERWHKTEDDILRMAVKNEVVLSAWWKGWINIHRAGCIGGWEDCFHHKKQYNDTFDINTHQIRELLANHNGAEISGFEHDEGDAYFTTESDVYSLDLEEPETYSTFHLTRERIVVTLKNAEATE